MIFAVTFLDIRNNPPAIDIVKVDINIRHGYALGVEKTLKEKCILKGVDVCDPKEISNNTARRRTAPGTDFNTVPARIVDKVPHDEKVTGISHVVNDAKLIGKALSNFICCIRIAHRDTLLTEGAQIGIITLKARRDGIERQLQFTKGKVHLTARSDLRRILDGPRIVCKKCRHLLL